jgi:hypothetical protein
MPDYPDDCKSRSDKNQISCSLFDMSCAMFHTRIGNKNGGKCCYYEAKP